MKPLRVYSLLMAGVAAMAFASIIIRFSGAPALIIAFYRVLFTAVLAAILAGPALKGNIGKIGRQDLLLIAVAGFFLALHFAFWISSLSYTSISSSVLFTNLQVLFVLIFSSVFLKERLQGMAMVGVLAALAGSIVIAGGDFKSGKLMGDMLALASGFFIAIYYLIGRRIRAQVPAWTYTFTVSGVAALVLAAACAAGPYQLLGYPGKEWILFLLLAIVPGIAGHGVLNWTLKHLKAPLVSVSILGESVGASILGYLIFNESLAWYQWAGGLMILSGIYIAATREVRGPDRDNELIENV